jgi:histidyl-tRNA synthetase
MGGKAAPAVGWALGVERVLELIKEQGDTFELPVPDAYAVIPEAAALPMALQALQALRAAGVSVQMHAGASAEGLGSMKSQFKKADGSGARFALIFGATELAEGSVAVKPLRGEKIGVAQAQTLQPLNNVAAWADTLRASPRS